MPTDPAVADPPLAFLDGGGRAARLIRARDWSGHPLGPPEQWPDALCGALSLVVNSPESMILCWGPELHFFFNDTYIPLLGPRVDWAMGAPFDEVWADALAQARPIIDDAMAGRSRRFDDLPWRLDTDRGEADTWWSFSYSRILDRRGEPAGLFIFTNETTVAVKTQAARVEAEAALTRAQEAGGIGLFTVGADNLVHGTPQFCRLFGLAHGPPIPASVLEGLIHPEDRHVASTGPSRADGTAPRDVEYRIHRADTGELRWIARKGEIEFDGDGRFRRLAGVVRDVTDQVATARALASEREQLAQMFEQAPTFMALLRGPHHRIELANPGYAALVGGRDIIGMPIADALPEVREQGFVAILDQVYRSGEAYEARDTPYVRPAVDGRDSQVRFCDFVYQPIRDGDGRVAGIFVQGADVTERTLAARALAESEKRYRTLLTAIEVGFCIVEMRFDDDGRADDYRIVEANPAFERLTGMVDKVGQWISEFAPDLERHWHDTYGEVARTGRAIRFENEAKPFGRWYDVTALPVGEPGQHRVAILFNDITHAKQLEQELRGLNASLEGEVDQRTRERDRLWTLSRDPFVVADAAGVWLSASPAWTDILGWSEEQLVGRTSEWMEHPDDHAATRAEVDRLVTNGGTQRFENRFRTRDGGYRWFSWTVATAEGLLYCNARDVTVEKEQAATLARAQDQLRQSQKVEAVGQLTGGVAHDFNNLLTVIRGSVELLRRPTLTEERRQRYTDAIADAADRATRLTGQLLAFARRQALRPEVFDVGGSIAALGDMVGTLSGPGIAVRLVLPDEPLFIDADRSQFDTAIVNMAVNARDAMAHQGVLTVTVAATATMQTAGGDPVAGEFVTVALADTGAGIAPDQIDQIFEPFFSTKGPGHGTGLGLSQVFGFAKQSGGEVSVRSSPGEGAIFTLCLPRSHASVTPDRRAGVDASAAAPGEGACVLVVEDSPEVGRFVQQALAELGHRSVLAGDAQSALALLDDDAAGFQLVFSDIVMPGQSGLDLGREVRRRFPELPVVLTSGYSTVIAQEGAHGFELLRKPYTLDELARVLARIGPRSAAAA